MEERFKCGNIEFSVPYEWFHNLCGDRAIEDKYDFEELDDRISQIAETIGGDTVYELALEDGVIMVLGKT